MSIDVFKWVEEVEKVYKDLIEKGKKENLDNLQMIRTGQEDLLEKKVKHYHDTVNFALKSLTENLAKEDQTINKKINDLKKQMKKKYQENKDNLIKLLIKDLRFDF
ncbi:MAG: hypothetical protein ACFFEN_04950 [Candidatus Thorarchaeota archaeon]